MCFLACAPVPVACDVKDKNIGKSGTGGITGCEGPVAASAVLGLSEDARDFEVWFKVVVEALELGMENASAW